MNPLPPGVPSAGLYPELRGTIVPHWTYEKYKKDTDYYEGPLGAFFCDGVEVCNFGDNTQYYPSNGMAPDDSWVAEMLRKLNAPD